VIYGSAKVKGYLGTGITLGCGTESFECRVRILPADIPVCNLTTSFTYILWNYNIAVSRKLIYL
jgi:hypothetical protein